MSIIAILAKRVFSVSLSDKIGMHIQFMQFESFSLYACLPSQIEN